MIIRLVTPLTEETCKKLISKQVEKDKKEAEIILKVILGKQSELPALRRRLAGSALHSLVKYMANETYKNAMLASAQVMMETGSEKFVSWDKGVLLIEVSDAIITGAEIIPGHKKLGEEDLKRRFKSKTLEYMREVRKI